MRVKIKLVITSAPKVRAITISTLSSKFAICLDAPKRKNGDKLVIPVPNIAIIQAGSKIIP